MKKIYEYVYVIFISYDVNDYAWWIDKLRDSLKNYVIDYEPGYSSRTRIVNLEGVITTDRKLKYCEEIKMKEIIIDTLTKDFEKENVKVCLSYSEKIEYEEIDNEQIQLRV